MQLVRWILSQGLDHFTLKLISIDMIDPKVFGHYFQSILF